MESTNEFLIKCDYEKLNHYNDLVFHNNAFTKRIQIEYCCDKQVTNLDNIVNYLKNSENNGNFSGILDDDDYTIHTSSPDYCISFYFGLRRRDNGLYLVAHEGNISDDRGQQLEIKWNFIEKKSFFQAMDLIKNYFKNKTISLNCFYCCPVPEN